MTEPHDAVDEVLDAYFDLSEEERVEVERLIASLAAARGIDPEASRPSLATLLDGGQAARLTEIEQEITRLPDVSAARIVADGAGRPFEVHILAATDKHPKQIVRDVQAVAMASFGIDLDRRIVSVVRLSEAKSAGIDVEGWTTCVTPMDSPDDA